MYFDSNNRRRQVLADVVFDNNWIIRIWNDYEIMVSVRFDLSAALRFGDTHLLSTVFGIYSRPRHVAGGHRCRRLRTFEVYEEQYMNGIHGLASQSQRGSARAPRRRNSLYQNFQTTYARQSRVSGDGKVNIGARI